MNTEPTDPIQPPPVIAPPPMAAPPPMWPPPQPHYFSPPPQEPSSQRHNRIYTYFLIGLACFYAVGTIMIVVVFSLNATEDPSFIIRFVTCFYGIVIALIIWTLILRKAAPRAGRIATIVLNILLLPLFPLGTAVGIYGLWKVDKRDR